MPKRCGLVTDIHQVNPKQWFATFEDIEIGGFGKCALENNVDYEITWTEKTVAGRVYNNVTDARKITASDYQGQQNGFSAPVETQKGPLPKDVYIARMNSLTNATNLVIFVAGQDKSTSASWTIDALRDEIEKIAESFQTWILA